MNTHDIKLPPLPGDQGLQDPFIKRSLEAYARAAIEADRQRRGEPVELIHMATIDEGELRMMSGRKPVDCELYAMPDLGRAPDLYAAPQPAEPVKVPSDADLFAIHNEYFPAMALGHDNYLSFARALLARYGAAQPAASAEPIYLLAEEEGHGQWSETDESTYQWWKAQGTRKVRMVYTAPVAAQAQPEEMVRFCPECGRLGEVDPEYHDCCPDGSHARRVPKRFAELCRRLFRDAIKQQPVSGADGLLQTKNAHPIPQSLRDKFSRIEDQALSNNGMQVFTQMRTAVQSFFEAQPQPSGNSGELPVELQGIAETVREGGGVWRSCSGCHELNEGHDTGPISKALGCALGGGCSECGGIGAIWDTTDYDAMADALAAQIESTASQAPTDEQAAFDIWFGNPNNADPDKVYVLPIGAIAEIRRMNRDIALRAWEYRAALAQEQS